MNGSKEAERKKAEEEAKREEAKRKKAEEEAKREEAERVADAPKVATKPQTPAQAEEQAAPTPTTTTTATPPPVKEKKWCAGKDCHARDAQHHGDKGACYGSDDETDIKFFQRSRAAQRGIFNERCEKKRKI